MGIQSKSYRSKTCRKMGAVTGPHKPISNITPSRERIDAALHSDLPSSSSDSRRPLVIPPPHVNPPSSDLLSHNSVGPMGASTGLSIEARGGPLVKACAG